MRNSNAKEERKIDLDELKEVALKITEAVNTLEAQEEAKRADATKRGLSPEQLMRRINI